MKFIDPKSEMSMQYHMTVDLKTHKVFVLLIWEEPRGFMLKHRMHYRVMGLLDI